MAGENRRVAAESAAHAQGLTDNLTKQGYAIESQTSAEWILRKKRRRGDQIVTIAIARPSMVPQPPSPSPSTSATSPGLPSSPSPATSPPPASPGFPPSPPHTGTWAPPQG